MRRFGASLQCSWTPLGRSLGKMPWKPPLLKLGTVGHQNKDSCMNLFKHFWCIGALWGGQFGSLGTPFGLICALLGHLLASFWLSWGVLERLLCPSWPKFAQDSEKKLFFECDARIWDPSWDPKIKKIDIIFFFSRVCNIDLYRYFNDSNVYQIFT